MNGALRFAQRKAVDAVLDLLEFGHHSNQVFAFELEARLFGSHDAVDDGADDGNEAPHCGDREDRDPDGFIIHGRKHSCAQGVENRG